MRWYPSGKLKLSAADLALLNSTAFREKAWTKPDGWLWKHTQLPPVPSAVFFALLTGAGG